MTDQPQASSAQFMPRLESVLVRTLSVLLMLVFALIFVLVVVLVVMRYGFNATIVGGAEATVFLFIYTTALGSAVEIAGSKHIRIETLVELLPPFWRGMLEMLQLVLIGVLHAFLFYFSVEWIRVVGTSRDPVLRTPEWMVEIAMPIGCVLAVLFCITRLFGLAGRLRGKASGA
ncbi:MAG: TRAP transporter small permease [Alphaproteobacteria bacterium]|nr:TRAP transporter small permease [Alphaproteobacteria bacterium]